MSSLLTDGQTVEYSLSGAIEARVDGHSVGLGGPKQRCVLAVMLCHHGHVVSVDRLIDSVWAEEAPPKALASVRSYVANLRRILNAPNALDPEAQRLESRPNGYRLNLLAGDSVDLYHFEALVTAGRTALVGGEPGAAMGTLDEALALWKGDPFGEFAYQDFAAADALRFTTLRATAVEARLDAGLRLGAAAELVPDIEAAVVRDPVSERLWAHLMLALHRSGRTADAVRAFERARVTLEREVGHGPGEGLRTLLEQINADAAELRTPPRRDTDVGPEVPFVGRDGELALVSTAVRRAAARSGGLLLLTGESGIGKTALARQATRLARASGLTVGWAAHPDGIGSPLLWTWIQLLRQLGAALGESTRHAVRTAVPGVVDALVPEWNDPGTLSRTAATGFALVEGIVTALRIAADDQPLLLVLDDLQLADETSLKVLALLAAQFPALPIAVIGNWTFFGADRPINRAGLDTLLGSTDTTSSVALRGVDQHSAAQLVDAITGAPIAAATSERLWRRAGGNPFYLKELARALDDTSAAEPDTVKPSDNLVSVIGRRLDVLDRASRRVLAAGAVLGPEFDVADLSDVVELPVSTVQQRLRPAHETALIDELPERPGGYRFTHGLLRDAVLTRLPTAERQALHAAVAATRAAGCATAAYEAGIAAADHAWRAGAALNPETALEIHETVIERALSRSAYDDVATLADHALQICQRLPAKPEALERQAMVWLHLAGAKGILEGQGSEMALAAVARAFEIGRQVQGRSFYSATALQCLMLCGHGRIAEAEVIATGLRERYEESGDPDIGLASDFTHVMIHMLRGDVDVAVTTGLHMMATFPPPETVSDPMHFVHPRVYCWMALAEGLRGDRDAMNLYQQRALQLAQSRGDVFNIVAAKLAHIECAALLGDVVGTAATADAVEREFIAAGGHQWSGAAGIIAVWAETLETGHDDAPRAFAAFDALTADGTCAMNGFFMTLLVDIERRCGRDEHADELLKRAELFSVTTGEHAWDAFIAERRAASPAVPRR